MPTARRSISSPGHPSLRRPSLAWPLSFISTSRQRRRKRFGRHSSSLPTRNASPRQRTLNQGTGYVNAARARDLLDGPLSRWMTPGQPENKVAQNVHQGVDIDPINQSQFVARLENLRPSERRDFYFVVNKNTAAVEVTLSNIRPDSPLSSRISSLATTLRFAVHSAKTSGFGDYLTGSPVPGPIFINNDAAFRFDRPETGLMRVTVLGDWTNAGSVSVDLLITTQHAPLAKHAFDGKIVEGEFRIHQFSLPPALSNVSFRLSFDGDWGSYPTNDLDLFLIAPDGSVNTAGATLNSPETVTIANPPAGDWTLIVGVRRIRQ